MTICVRCGNNPVAVRAVCQTCSDTLCDMHQLAEYTLFNRTYYIPSEEGTSFFWLLNNGYKRDMGFSYIVSGSQIERVQADQTKTFENSS